jgi:hypothetical protein
MATPEGTKRCSRCREVKPMSEFHRASHNRSGDGRRSACKECRWLPNITPLLAHEFADLPPPKVPKPSRAYEKAAAEEAEESVGLKSVSTPRPGDSPDRSEYYAELKAKVLADDSPAQSRPSSSTSMPRYLRDSLADDSPKSDLTPREQVIQRLGEMDVCSRADMEERREELRIPRIYDSGSTMPRYLREALREGRL